MKNFTQFMNKAIPAVVDGLADGKTSNLQRVETEGARPRYVANNVQIQNIYDYTAAFMLKEKILDGYDGIMKFLSYLRLTDDVKKTKIAPLKKGR